MFKQRAYFSVMVLLAGTVPCAHAESVHKCTGADGVVSYQREPCTDARASEEKLLDPNRNVIRQELPPPSPSSNTADAPNVPPPAPAPTFTPRRRGY
jgi:hypothetical protein